VPVLRETTMDQPRAAAPRPLPPALIWVGSLAILFHFVAVVMLVLAAQSGPWATRFGESPAEGPLFAKKISDVLGPAYLHPLRIAHNYHFLSNRLTTSEVYFEARLKDSNGKVTTLKFPDAKDNGWMRHRQSLLALGLGDDIPVQAPRGEVIPAPGQKMKTLTIWEPVSSEEAQKLRETLEPLAPESPRVFSKLREVPENLVPKDREVFRPSEWSLLLARSYARFLCREHGAVSCELIRHSKEPVLPAVMFLPEPPPRTFDELVCSFGELPP
jgi:hypothetical protein